MKLSRSVRVLGLFAAFAGSLAGCTEGRGVKGDRPIQTVEGRKPVPGQEPFLVKLETTKGDVVLEVHPEWAPLGAQRFRELVELGFYNDCRFFRVLPGFMAQVGICGDPERNAKWRDAEFPDDPVVESNTRGMVTFAKRGVPNSRTTQFFINFSDDNTRLDGMGFAPFAKVISGMDAIDKINAEYRERPDQQRIQNEGNAYLDKAFPGLDSIKKATVLTADKKPDESKQ